MRVTRRSALIYFESEEPVQASLLRQAGHGSPFLVRLGTHRKLQCSAGLEFVKREKRAVPDLSVQLHGLHVDVLLRELRSGHCERLAV